ncbi:type VI secretion system contractile sheath small subunit [Serratia ureilytica]
MGLTNWRPFSVAPTTRRTASRRPCSLDASDTVRPCADPNQNLTLPAGRGAFPIAIRWSKSCQTRNPAAGRNSSPATAPRVQIEYDVEIYGAERKIQLPFVMGVMADLVGKAVDPQASVEEQVHGDRRRQLRRAHESLKPRVAYQVDNT